MDSNLVKSKRQRTKDPISHEDKTNIESDGEEWQFTIPILAGGFDPMTSQEYSGSTENPHQSPSPMARDYIAQAYLGLWGSKPIQDRARRRIDWITTQVKGPNVLDVGCSEGIMAILLAREGMEVTGIDINPDALAYANELLENENEFIAERVRYILGDLSATDFEPETFSCVVMGEIIEHLAQPAMMIEDALHYLEPGGRLVVTTPFGYFPDPAHRQTFTLRSFTQLMQNLVAPEHLSVVDGYIRFTGTKRSVSAEDWVDYDAHCLLNITEPAAVAKDVTLYGIIEHQKTSAIQQAQLIKKQVADLESTKTSRLAAEKEMHRLSELLIKQRTELSQLSDELANFEHQTEALQTRLAKLEDELDQSKQEGISLQLESAQMAIELAEAHKIAETLQTCLTERENELDHSKQEGISLKRETERLAEELAGYNAENKNLLKQLRSYEELIRNLEKQLTDTQAELTKQSSASDEKLQAMEAQLSQATALWEKLSNDLSASQNQIRRISQSLDRKGAQEKRTQDMLSTAQLEINRLKAKKEKKDHALGVQSDLIEKLHRDVAFLKMDNARIERKKYLAQHRVEEIESTISYRLGIAITRGLMRPSPRNLKQLASSIVELGKEGLRKKKGEPDPEVASLSFQHINGSEQKLPLTCPAPSHIRFENGAIHFDVPVGEKTLLISKGNGRISELPAAHRLALAPDTDYSLSARFLVQKGTATLHLIEYGERYCLQGQTFPLGETEWNTQWKTHTEHSDLCLALELEGSGSLTVSDLRIQRTNLQNHFRKILIDGSTNSAIKLSSKPVWMSLDCPPKSIMILLGTVQVENAEDLKPGYALVRVKFFNQLDEEIPGPYNQISHSATIGPYVYLRVNTQTQDNSELFRLSPPMEARRVALGFQKWKAQGTVRLTNQLEMIENRIWSCPCFEKPQPTLLGKPVVASILDAFSEDCFRYEMNLVPLTKENWQEEIEQSKPEFLLVESAWQGNNGNWRYILTNYAKRQDNPLRELLQYCKRTGLPTVFWNKEDPPNYNIFIDVAMDFDFIYTTDVNCIPNYKEVCGHDQVYCLPFAAQPAIHNPIGKQEYPDLEIAFAGTWYNRKHPERSELMPVLLNPASSYKLFIFDRMSEWNTDDSYQFPECYRPFLNPKISYDEMLNLHRMFKVFLNTNSVTESPTMFSRRIFEILASSTPVVSTSSLGVDEMFKGIVPVVHTEEQAQQELDRLLTNDWYRKHTGHRGYRKVMLEHTFNRRITEMLTRLNLPVSVDTEFPKVTLAVPTNRPENMKFVIENFERQHYPNLELIIVLNNDRYNKGAVELLFANHDNVKVFQLPESATLGECLNLSIDQSSGEYWAKLDDDNIYLEDFVTDLMLPYRYCDADIVGKGTYFIYLEGLNVLALRFPNHEHRYVDFMSGSAMVIRKKVFTKVRFPERSVGEDTQFMKDCLSNGMKMYSTDCWNYVVVRKADLNQHTWKINEEELLKTCRKVSDGLQLDYVKC